MHVEQGDLKAAEKAGVITSEQAKKLWSFWTKTQMDVPSFQLSHVMYYFGGLLAISAVTLFFTQAWDKMRGLPLFALSTFFFLLGLFLTRFFLNKKLRIPAGIMATFSLAVVPLAVYNIQLWFGYAPEQLFHYSDYHYWINWYWIPMELVTLLIGIIMLYFYRFSFLLFPIAVTLWYMGMDLVPLIFHMTHYQLTDRATFSLFYGLVILLVAIYTDLKYSDKRQDYAFWLYIVGVVTFWGGLSCQESHNEWSRFLYCMVNVVMLFTSVFLNRRVFAIFGVLGILGYLGHLSYSVFQNSLGFPIVLVFLGLIIIFAATRWTRMEQMLARYFRSYIPKVFLKRK